MTLPPTTDCGEKRLIHLCNPSCLDKGDPTSLSAGPENAEQLRPHKMTVLLESYFAGFGLLCILCDLPERMVHRHLQYARCQISIFNFMRWNKLLLPIKCIIRTPLRKNIFYFFPKVHVFFTQPSYNYTFQGVHLINM